MISDYARLSQLEEEAINSAGASGKQFEKTLESMNSKVTNLQNQIDTFLTQIMDSGFLKFLIDAGKYLTEFANKLTSLPGILGSISKVGLGFGIFKGGAKLVDTIFRSFTQNGKQFSGLGARIGGNIFMGIKSVFHKGKVGLQNMFGKMIDYDAVSKNSTLTMKNYSTVLGSMNSQLKAGTLSQKVYDEQLSIMTSRLNINTASASAYNSVISQGLAIKGSDLILQDEQIASDTLEILSTDALTKEKKEEMIQETINQKLREKGLVLEKQGFFFKMKNYLALMFGTQATREQAIANLGYASTADAAAQATNRFSKAIYKIPFLGWILAVIAALITLITIIVKCTRTTQQSIDNADKAAERATSRMQELSNEIEGLADTFSKIQELGDSFDDLTKGSVEWTSKLIENNQYLEDLVDKYEILQDYLAYDENGIAYFKEGYENALVNELQSQYEEQRTSKIANEYDAARLRYQKGEISYQDYVSAQSAYVSQGIRNKASDDASIAAANLTSIKFGSEYEKVWDEQEEALKDLAKVGSGFTTYNNDTLKKIGQDLGLWYLKDGDIYNDKDFQEELDLNEDDMAERIIRSNTLTAIQKNTKDTANELRQQDKFTQKIASGNWGSITAKDLQEHGVSNSEEARRQLNANYQENNDENWIAWLKTTNPEVRGLINEFEKNPNLNKDANSTLWYLKYYDSISEQTDAQEAQNIFRYLISDPDDYNKEFQKAKEFDLSTIYGEAQGELDNMLKWAASLGITSFDAAFSAFNTLDKESQDLLANPDFQNSIYEYSKEFGSGVSAALALYLSANDGMESDFAQVLSTYANSGLKNLDEAFKGLDISTTASVDDILNFIQVQRNLGNETSILTDNFIKLTEGMTISQEKLQEWYQIINKGARITEGKTGYDTYSKDEIDILKDTMAISSDDILRVGEDQYKVINKTAEQITHYLGNWNAKISGVNKGSENNLKFVSMLTNENDDNRDRFKKTGSEEGRDLKFGTQENQDIYQVAKGIHEAGGVGVVSDEEAKTGLGAGQMSMTDAKTAYKRLLFQQQVLANNITDEEEATKLWNKIDAQVNREMVSPEAIQQALNGFISENYYESVEDYEAAQNANFLLDAGESGYRNDTSRDKMYNSSSEAMRETAQKAAQLVVNERNLNSVVQMVTSTVSKQNPSLAKNSDLMKELAIAISDAQNGFETIRNVISDCEEDLKDFGSIKYYQAIDKIAQAFQNIGIEGADSAWVGANLEDIMDFYNGSASAADRLYKNLVKIKLAQMDNTELASQLQTVINGLTFDTEGIGTFTEKANAMLTALVGTTGENMADIEQIFKSFGVDLEYIHGADGKITGVKAVNQFKVGANYNKRETQKENSSNKWENSYDWLYNLTQKINEELRIREKLEKRYDRILNNRKMNEKDVIAAREKELQSLMKELNLQTEMYEKRRGEISAILRDNKDLTKYATYDFENNMVQINWDKINKVSDETLGGRIETFIEKLENAESEFEDAFDSIEDIYDTVQDIYDDSRQNYLDFENRVLEAVVNQYQLEIDRLTEIDNSINDSNSKLLNSIQKSIDEQRQTRQNAETEEDLTDKLNQLLYKQQDKTSSLTDLKTLEKELEDSRQDYIDTLVDQKISELQEQNDEAAEQRQRQIELMEGQLEQAKDQGLLWDEVNLILKEGIYGPDGQISQNSKLVQILQELDKYNSLSEEGKKNWLDELSVQYKQYEEFGAMKTLLNENLNTIGSRLETLGSQLNTLDWTIQSTGDKIVQGYRDTVVEDDEKNNEVNLNVQNAILSSNSSIMGKISMLQEFLKNNMITPSAFKTLMSNVKIQGTGPNGQKRSWYYQMFATGGLADFTGPAWLDGSKSSPELVLNPRDTENFIQLKDILSSIMSNNIPTITEGARTANSNFEININVDSISSDYDVDRLVERVKKDIVEDSSYRNPVVLNLLR